MPDDLFRRCERRTYRADLFVLLGLWCAGGVLLALLSLHEVATYGLGERSTAPFDPAVLDFVLPAVPPAVVVACTIGRSTAWRLVAWACATGTVLLQGSLAGFFVVLRFPGDREPVSPVALADTWSVYPVSCAVHFAVVGAVAFFRR